MQNYSKLIAAVVGNLVGIAVVWLSFQVPGIVECAAVADPELPDACTVLGFEQAQITAAVMAVLNSAFVFFFPPNRPEA